MAAEALATSAMAARTFENFICPMLDEKREAEESKDNVLVARRVTLAKDV